MVGAVVGEQRELAIVASAGEGFGDDLRAVEKAVDAEVAPFNAELAIEREGEGGILKVFELLAVRVEFSD